MSRGLCLAVLVFGSLNAVAQSLSEQKVVELHRAHVSDAVLIQQIQNDGISFSMDADTTLRLKKAGIPDAVLQTLLTSGHKRAASNGDTKSFLDSARGLYDAGKYPQLADTLKEHLALNQADARARTILVLTLLKMNDQAGAMSQFEILKAPPADDSKQQYVKQVENLFNTLRRQDETKAKLEVALRQYRAKDAADLIQQLGASNFQKNVLLAYLDIYRGDYEGAKKRIRSMNSAGSSEEEVSTKISRTIDESERSFASLMQEIDDYLYSPLQGVACMGRNSFKPDWDRSYFPQLQDFSIQHYLDLVQGAALLAPLNERVMDLAFHAELLSGQYSDLERFGDTILTAKGDLAIPFFSSDRFFSVVVDARAQRIYTRPDTHVLSVIQFARSRDAKNGKLPEGVLTSKQAGTPHDGVTPVENTFAGWAGDPTGTAAATNCRMRVSLTSYSDKCYEALRPFDLRFTDVRALTQPTIATEYYKAHPPHSDYEARTAYALRFDPAGDAPEYAFLNVLSCQAGASAEKTVTKNLGQFVLHAIGRNDVQAKLADPNDGPSLSGSGWASTLSTVLGTIYSSMPAQNPLQSVVQQEMRLAQQHDARVAQEAAQILQGQKTNWYAVISNRAIEAVQADRLKAIDDLVVSIH